MLYHRYRLADSSPAIVALAKKTFAASRNQASWRLSHSLSLPWSVEVFGAPTSQYEDWLSRCRHIWPRTTLQQRSLTCGVFDNFITTSLLHIFALWDLHRLRPGRPASQPDTNSSIVVVVVVKTMAHSETHTESQTREVEQHIDQQTKTNDHLSADWFTRMKP
jgi:hypothetical protein